MELSLPIDLNQYVKLHTVIPDMLSSSNKSGVFFLFGSYVKGLANTKSILARKKKHNLRDTGFLIKVRSSEYIDFEKHEEDIYNSYNLSTNSIRVVPKSIIRRKRKHSDTLANASRRHPTNFSLDGISCCVCDSDFDDYKCLSSVRDISTKIGVFSCCGNHDHAICSKCLHISAMNFENHPIKGGSNKFHCIHHECSEEDAWPLNDFKGILTKQEHKKLIAHSRKYLNQGCYYTTHPQCGTRQILQEGEYTLWCAHCKVNFCYECGMDIVDDWCMCHNPQVTNQPYAINRYFKRPDREHPCQDYLMRNYELNEHICVQQLKRIMADSSLVCTQCNANIYKTSSCNELQHCHGSRICWFCAYRSDVISQKCLIDHFGSTDGIKLCPRFLEGDTHLNKILEYKCNSDCHDHLHECTLPDHQQGRKKMEIHLKSVRLYKALLSIPDPLKIKVTDNLKRSSYKESLAYLIGAVKKTWGILVENKIFKLVQNLNMAPDVQTNILNGYFLNNTCIAIPHNFGYYFEDEDE